MNAALVKARQGAVVIGAVFVVSTLGYHWIAERPLLESLYWTTITIAGVGYGQEIPDSVGPGRQVFSVMVIMVGMLAVAYTIGMLLQAVVEGQVEQSLGTRRMNREIEKLENHTIVCGFGRIGQHLTKRLTASGVPFVLIDACPETIQEAKCLGYLVVEGNATDEEILREAGILRAESIVVALNRDADNVFVTLTASNINPELRIVARGEQPSTEKKLLQAGASQVVLPAVIGADKMAEVIARPLASEFLHKMEQHTGLQTEIEELTVTRESHLLGLTLSDAAARFGLNSIVVAVRRESGSVLFHPGDDTVFMEEDSVLLVGPADEIEGLPQRLACEQVAVSAPIAASEVLSPV